VQPEHMELQPGQRRVAGCRLRVARRRSSP
jgi:hypothetical protein